MRQEPEYFGDQELALVYVARKLKHAIRLEELLTEAQIDYAVESDKYVAGLLWRSERVGAFFYVLPEHADAAREVVRIGGWKPAD